LVSWKSNEYFDLFILYRITSELRQLIKQRNKLQAQILNGDANADIEKKFKKMRNKICKHAKTLKGNI
jgi:hypothetical protein